MMVAGLLHLLASSGVILPSTTTTTTVFMSSMRRAGASSAAAAATANDDTATDLCPAELLACDEDPTCSGCISVTETSSTEFWECDTAEPNEVCAEGWRAMCCIDEASEFDCMGNGVYLEYVTCLLVESGCSIEDVSCPGEVEANSINAGDMALDATQGGAGAEAAASSSSSSTISGSSIAITLAFAFVLFAAGISIGVVMAAKCMPGSHPFTRIK